MSLTVKIEGLPKLQGDLKAGKAAIDPEFKHAMVLSVNAVKNTAQRLVPYKTGTLRRSIFTDVNERGTRGEIGQDAHIAKYGVFIEYGTKAHDIFAKTAGALFWKGAMHPVKVVHHPGTKPTPYMKPAFEQNLEAVKAYFSKAGENIVLKMAGRA